MVLIHVIRNPFDNITTRARGGSHVLREVDDELLLKTIHDHFNDVETISKIKKENKFPRYFFSDMDNDCCIISKRSNC